MAAFQPCDTRGPACADSIVYEEDFSSDPGWTTNDPANMYWDSANGWYHIANTNGVLTYTYFEVPVSGSQAYTLEWDILMQSAAWAADVRFGMFEDGMHTELSSAEYLFSLYGIGSLGTGTVFYGQDTSGYNAASPGYDLQYSFGTWYHNELTWDPATETISWSATRLSDNLVYPTITLFNVGPFDGIDRIGVSQVDHTYATGQTAVAYLDNVRLTTPVPEPLSSSILAIGLCITGFRLRRRIVQ